MKQCNRSFRIVALCCSALLLGGCQSLHHRTPVKPTAPKIALLVPLHGPYRTQGEAVKNGFLENFYQEKTAREITLYDTSQNDIGAVYQQAKNDGAELIVGPLLKENLENLLAKQKITLPTLALNTTTEHSHHLYQLNLSPDTEITQTAQYMWDHGQRRTLVIAFTDPLGTRIQTEWITEWHRLGGEIIETLNYPNTASTGMWALPLQTFLHIPAAVKEKRHHIIPQPRQDFDSILLIAPPEVGRQIVPLLRFYGIRNQPIYTTSMIYNGKPNPESDQDLDGIIWADMPFITDMYPSDRKPLPTYPRLYALGIDAYRVITHLKTWATLPQVGHDGVTGTLYINHHVVYRELSWFCMQNGHPLQKVEEILSSATQ